MSRRHFGAQHIKNFYAGMSGMGKPVYKRKSLGTVADSIARARQAAAREAAANRKKK